MEHIRTLESTRIK